MKQVPQNEMDVLLRKLSRIDLDGLQEERSGHLDPDELNAYAQNALPAMARAEYTEHLADCLMCRRLVTGLTPALVPVTPKKEAGPSSVREFFSKLTSPLFLRYAVPSLAAVLILVMGFLFVNRKSGEMVAVNETPSTQVGIANADQNSSPENVAPKQVVINTAKDEARPKQSNADARQESSPTSAAVDDLRGQEETAKRAETARADEARQNAPAPAAPPAEVGRVSGERELAKSTEAGEKKKQAANEAQPAKEEARKLSDLDSSKDAPKAQAAPSARRAAEGAAVVSQSSGAGRDRQDKDAKETRRVAGHSFRKVNGVWIDDAYGSQATVNLSRGSEQFRALVADEPAIRTIAEQLDGEIIVVWKGRAYRIR